MQTKQENQLEINNSIGTAGYARTVGEDGKSYRTGISALVSGAIGGDIEQLENDVEALQTTVGEHTADIQNNSDDISDLQTLTSGHTTSIGNLQTAVETNTGDIADVKEDLEDETTARENADTKMASEISDLFEMGTPSTYNNDKVPYLFRASGGGKYIGGIEKDTIVGGTVAWNQLCNGASVTVPSGHKYYMVKGGTASIGASTGTAITGLTSGTDIVSDLTQLFGSTIADYIYSLEQANAGAGGAWFKKLFPKDYYEYNEGELISVSGLQSHDMVGFNQWDEEWEIGSINNTTGENTTAGTNRIRSKNYIPCLPNTNYCVWNGDGVQTFLYFYDEDKNFISVGSITSANPRIDTTPSNCYYMKFRTDNNAVATYNHNICINLSLDGERDGEYEPYIKHSYALDDSLTLRGIPKLDSANNLYYDGDRYLPSGEVERRYGIVDLGTLDWTYDTSVAYPRFTSSQISDASGASYSGVQNVICPLYLSNGAAVANTNVDKTVWINNKKLYIHDYSYTDASTFKTAMDGVMLVYELATPTTETADPYQNPQIVDKYGTEEYVTTGIVPVGHDTDYYLDADSVLTPPSAAGTYSLKVTVASDGSKSYSWVSD